MGCGKSVPAVSEESSEKPAEISRVQSVQSTDESQQSKTLIACEPIHETLVSMPTEIKFKPIHSAIRWNKPLAEIEQLLTSTAAANCVDTSNGNCPIHIAAQNGHTDIIKLLISKNADLNAKNSKGNTGIHMAVGYDYFLVAKLLMAAGADENIVNDLGIPAHLGLEGDKAMGIAALVSAESAEDVNTAFELCEEKLEKINKINFVSAGLKAKKNVGSQWTPDHQTRFKLITSKLS